MRNTLEDYEYNNAVKEVEKLLDGILCDECIRNMPEAKEFVFAVLESIGINY